MLALILASALFAQAAELSPEVKSAMIEAIYDKCTLGSDAEFKLESVTKEEEAIEQNVVDIIYTATFTATYLGKDETTVLKKQLTAIAAKYAISNPAVPSVEVLSVYSNDKRLCD